jgi:hypothetical protein
VVARDAKPTAACCSTTTTANQSRLWLNRSKEYLGGFDGNKVETRIPIDDVRDIEEAVVAEGAVLTG